MSLRFHAMSFLLDAPELEQFLSRDCNAECAAIRGYEANGDGPVTERVYRVRSFCMGEEGKQVQLPSSLLLRANGTGKVSVLLPASSSSQGDPEWHERGTASTVESLVALLHEVYWTCFRMNVRPRADVQELQILQDRIENPVSLVGAASRRSTVSTLAADGPFEHQFSKRLIAAAAP